jgi:hypothetical protein
MWLPPWQRAAAKIGVTPKLQHLFLFDCLVYIRNCSLVSIIHADAEKFDVSGLSRLTNSAVLCLD